MLAILVLERDPLKWAELGEAAQQWLRDAGFFAAVALGIWCLAYLIRSLSAGAGSPERPGGRAGGSLQARLFVACLVGSALLYAAFGVVLIAQGTEPKIVQNQYGKSVTVQDFTPTEKDFLTGAGGLALLALLLPVAFTLGRLRWRRIWAIARLSIKDAIRHRVLWVFSFLLLVVLFASWFLDSDKPEFQLRNYVWVVDWSMTILLILAAGLLAAFGIPSDIKSQTIHTVVTKPVERFEIVLGRFLGYTLLMTAVLVVATGLGLVYLFRNINEEAKRENYKARVPVYGQLSFQGTEGENVGREWTHRKYIAGPRQGAAPTVHYAIWSFDHIPASLADRPDGVRCEFSFDIYRTHKATVEGQGIFCAFQFATPRAKLIAGVNGRLEMDPEQKAALDRRRRALEQQGKSPREVNNAIAEEFGLYQLPSKEITDYHTQAVQLPEGLFKNIARGGAGGAEAAGEGSPPALRVIVNVTRESQGQLLGVARQDLYLLDNERSFEVNYFKSAAGLWCRLALVIGLAVACGTYLSGIIAWICTMFLFCLGLFRPDIQQLALGLNEGGGPMEALIRVANRQPVAAQLEDTSFVQAASLFDEGFRWTIGQVLKLVPDVNRFDLSRYVSNGFDISVTGVLLIDCLLPLLAYLLPWLLLAYYLIKYREVANPG